MSTYLFSNPCPCLFSVSCGYVWIRSRFRETAQRVFAVVTIVWRTDTPAPPSRIQTLQKTALRTRTRIPRPGGITSEKITAQSAKDIFPESMYTYPGVELPKEAAFVNRSCIKLGEIGRSSCLVLERLEPPERLVTLFLFSTSLNLTCEGLGERVSDSCNLKENFYYHSKVIHWLEGIKIL